MLRGRSGFHCLFDTAREVFFAANTRHHGLRAGYERRRLFYWLHTALLHVALFGDEYFCGFAAQTAESIRQLPDSLTLTKSRGRPMIPILA